MQLWLKINIAEQKLIAMDGDQVLDTYLVSSAIKGVGEKRGSEQTPRGWHVIRARIGQSCPINTVFKARRPTGEIYTSALGQQYPERDWILTRILWLSGLERGKNRLGQVDTMRRYIYIHGTPDYDSIGQPASHGCIRMRNEDLLALFEKVPVGTRVLIEES